MSGQTANIITLKVVRVAEKMDRSADSCGGGAYNNENDAKSTAMCAVSTDR